ncbi:cysteine hydrolase [Oxyplasma meridianum]|uniref:Cysteine hydrolase n=1 Tax=Oxyplasma meridianum TaxID=3073602 RepID=A0AAX4NGB5_9ARCH
MEKMWNGGSGIKSAWIVVDLVNDFVSGKFGSQRSVQVAERTGEVIGKLEGSVDIVFTMDTHIRNDPEFRVWGEHCLQGTESSELHKSVSKYGGQRIRKRHFDSFYESDLDGYLRAKGVRNLFISGISSDICVLHTAAGAYFRYYGINIISDLCASIDESSHDTALEFMRKYYGARIIKAEEFEKEIAKWQV